MSPARRCLRRGTGSLQWPFYFRPEAGINEERSGIWLSLKPRADSVMILAILECPRCINERYSRHGRRRHQKYVSLWAITDSCGQPCCGVNPSGHELGAEQRPFIDPLWIPASLAVVYIDLSAGNFTMSCGPELQSPSCHLRPRHSPPWLRHCVALLCKEHTLALLGVAMNLPP